MKKNLMIAMILLSVVLVSFVISASVTGYLVRGGAVSTEGVTATLQGVKDGVATVEVTTPAGATEIVRVQEGKTAQVGDVEISASDLRSGGLFKRSGANVEVNVISEETFQSAFVECYNGDSKTLGDETSCKTDETWWSYGEDFCKNKCSLTTEKCGMNTFVLGPNCDSGEPTEPTTGGQCVNLNCKWEFNSEQITGGSKWIGKVCDNPNDVVLEGSCGSSDNIWVEVKQSFTEGGNYWQCAFDVNPQFPNARVTAGALCCSQ